MTADFSDFDPLAKDLPAHLWDRLADMRSTCPVAKSDAYGGLWMLTRYSDVWDAARDWETFCSGNGAAMIPIEDFGDIRNIPIDTDPPYQKQVRRLVDRHLTARSVAPFEPRIRQ